LFVCTPEAKQKNKMLQLIGRAVLAFLFTTAGVGHFQTFDKFMSLMEGLPLKPLHSAAVYISGLLEIILGLSIIINPSAFVFKSLILLVLLMTPANINMWYRNLEFNGKRMGSRGHLLRGFAQLVLLFGLYKLMEVEEASN